VSEPRKHVRGIGLLEGLVAIAILAVGLLACQLQAGVAVPPEGAQTRQIARRLESGGPGP